MPANQGIWVFTHMRVSTAPDLPHRARNSKKTNVHVFLFTNFLCGWDELTVLANQQNQNEGMCVVGEISLSHFAHVTVHTVESTDRLQYLCFMLCHRTMKAGAGLLSALALFLLMGAVFTQSTVRKPKKPTRRPATIRKPSVPKPAVPAQPEPQEPTDFPPPILGPPSIYPDCPRECSCSPSYPNSLNCENRNIRVIPVIPFRTHYLYLQNNYISEVTAEPFLNATEVRWVNLANNRIHRINKQVRKCPRLIFMIWK